MAKDNFNGGEICLSNIIFSDASDNDIKFPDATICIEKITQIGSIALNHASVEMRAGETVTLKATVSPDNATNKAVTWTVDNKDVATVDGNGNVTAKAVGNATVTAKAADGSNVMAQCRVNVVEITDVDDVMDNRNNKHVIYSITGIKLSYEFKDLPPGIYIINNKKTIKK